MTTRTAFLALLAAVAAMAFGLVVAHLEGGPGISDTGIYRIYGERIASGDVPYRDFVVEYPPGGWSRSWRRLSSRPHGMATTRPSRR